MSVKGGGRSADQNIQKLRGVSVHEVGYDARLFMFFSYLFIFKNISFVKIKIAVLKMKLEQYEDIVRTINEFKGLSKDCSEMLLEKYKK